MHAYPDEFATVALAKLLQAAREFVADRLESFVTDIHAREHRIKGKIAVKHDGPIPAFEIDDLTGVGPYSVYPRTSGIEGNQVVNLIGGPYTCGNYRAKAPVVFTNKNVTCQYRAVGHPIAVAVTEGWWNSPPQSRHGPAGAAPAQTDRRRRLSVHVSRRAQVREALAPQVARPSRFDDELCRPAR